MDRRDPCSTRLEVAETLLSQCRPRLGTSHNIAESRGTEATQPDSWALLPIEIPVPQRILGVQIRGSIPNVLRRVAREEPTQ